MVGVTGSSPVSPTNTSAVVFSSPPSSGALRMRYQDGMGCRSQSIATAEMGMVGKGNATKPGGNLMASAPFRRHLEIAVTIRRLRGMGAVMTRTLAIRRHVGPIVRACWAALSQNGSEGLLIQRQIAVTVRPPSVCRRIASASRSPAAPTWSS